MRHRSRVLLTALTTTLVLATAVAGASARRLEVNNIGIRVVWSGANILVFSGGEVRCAVTIEGVLHSRTFSKVSGQLIGYITRARVTHPCETGEGWALTGNEGLVGEVNTLPWHIRYDSFIGALPRITGFRVQLIGVGFLVELLMQTCLYKSTEGRPIFGIFEIAPETGTVTGFRVDETTTISKFSGIAFCPSTGRLSKTGAVTLLETTAAIAVRLVA